MNAVRSYLPSARFAVLVGAILLSVIIIWIAQAIVQPKTGGLLVASLSPAQSDANWQALFASSTAYQDAQEIDAKAAQLVNAASTTNLTDTVGRSVLINTLAAYGQGLGSDIPTQNDIVTDAIVRAQTPQRTSTLYIASDFATIVATKDSLHTFGNRLAQTITAHSAANTGDVLIAVGLAVDTKKPSSLTPLAGISQEYYALAEDIAALQTPLTVTGAMAQIANNYVAMGDACTDVGKLLTDPIRGLTGLQKFNSTAMLQARALAGIAGVFKNNGILFNTGEAGSAWEPFRIAEEAAVKEAAQTLQNSGQAAQ